MDSTTFQSKINKNTDTVHPGSAVRIAGIDIGTNTILMVIGEKNSNREIKYIRNEHSIARLGEGVDKSHFIKPEAIDRAKNILKNYKEICDDFNVNYIAAAGTSALRDAVNREEVIKELSSVIDCQIKVISGEEEARLSFLGTFENDNPCVVLDIGGGSTEFIFGSHNEIKNRYSLPIGAVRLTERYFKVQPVSEINIKKAELNLIENIKEIDPLLFNGEFIGVAGTPTTLSAVAQELNIYKKDKVHNYILDINTVNEIFQKLKLLNVEGIKKITGIHPDRADIITAGTLILLTIMNYFKIDKCKVSTRGLRYGILIDLALKV